MKAKDQTYYDLLAAGADKEIKVVIGRTESSDGTVYLQDQIVEDSVSISSALMSELSIGNAVSSELSITLYNPSEIPRMAAIDVYTRLNDGTIQSDWDILGTFYIDTREKNKVDNTLKLKAYDAMLRAEQPMEGETGQWPRHDYDTVPNPLKPSVVAMLCNRLNLELDPRTITRIERAHLLNYQGQPYDVQYPSDQTYREILCDLAVAYAGSWVITTYLDSTTNKPKECLYLVPLTGTGDTFTAINGVEDLNIGDILDPITKVTLMPFSNDDEDSYSAGDDSGYEIAATCTFATQGMANSVLGLIGGYAYKAFDARSSLVDPSIELGDKLIFDNVSYVIVSMDTAVDALYTADISAPYNEEVDHEYSFKTSVEKTLSNAVQLGKDYYGTSITRQDGIVIRKETSGGSTTKVKLNSDELKFYDEDGNLAIYLDPVTGKYRFIGNVSIEEGEININNKFIIDENGNAQMSGDSYIYGGTLIAGTPIDSDGFTIMTQRGLEVYNADNLLKILLGYTSQDEDYPFIQIGSGWGSSSSLGLIKKFIDGLWIGNSAPKEATGTFVPVSGYNGMFFRFTDNKAYIVSGTDMQSVYTGEAIARFG